MWKTSGTFDNKLGRTAPRSRKNIFGLVRRNLNMRISPKWKLWMPNVLSKINSFQSWIYQYLIIICLPCHHCQLWLHELKQAFSGKFCYIPPKVWPPGNATARTLANNVAELCYREEVVIIWNITTKPNHVCRHLAGGVATEVELKASLKRHFIYLRCIHRFIIFIVFNLVFWLFTCWKNFVKVDCIVCFEQNPASEILSRLWSTFKCLFCRQMGSYRVHHSELSCIFRSQLLKYFWIRTPLLSFKIRMVPVSKLRTYFLIKLRSSSDPLEIVKIVVLICFTRMIYQYLFC